MIAAPVVGAEDGKLVIDVPDLGECKIVMCFNDEGDETEHMELAHSALVQDSDGAHHMLWINWRNIRKVLA